MEKLADLAGTYGVTYFFMSLVVAGIAQGKNRSGFAWWVISAFATPPVALFLLVVFCDKPHRVTVEKKETPPAQ